MRVLVLLLVTGLAAAVGLDDLATQRQERLYYDETTLPATVDALIAAPIPVEAYIDHYHATDDEILRFNLVLILDKRLRREAIRDAERERALEFLRGCLREANPWIRTEAVYALGNARGLAAEDDIRACLDADSRTLVYHAAIALMQVLQRPPELSDEQQATVREVHAAHLAGTHNELADAELEAYLKRASF